MRYRWIVGGVLMAAAAIVVAAPSTGIRADTAETSEAADATGADALRRVAKPRDPASALRVRRIEGAPIVAAPGSRLETQRLLRRRDFDAVTTLLEAKQKRAEASVRYESELTYALDAFDVADPAMTPLLDAWVAAKPRSFAPWLARARHTVAVAYALRGTKSRDKTSAKQFESMDAALRKGLDDLDQALQRNAKLIELYRLLIVTARTKGDQEACLRLADRALEIMPASFEIRVAIGHCLLPRWGGSYPALEAFAQLSQEHVKDNPRLAALKGFVDWDRGRVAASDEDYGEAVALYTAALEIGDVAQLYEDRADANQRRKRHSDALADVAQALALRPEMPDTLILRARVLTSLGRRAEALTDVRLVAELDPTNEDLGWFRKTQVKHAASTGRELLEGRDATGALEQFNWGIDLGGEDAAILFWRGRAYLAKNQHDRALEDFNASIALDPRYLESYKNADWVMAQRGRWDEIIAQWTRYIALEPLSGEAYLERGGAHHHKGDGAAAIADIRKACDLGTQRACDLAKNARR